MQDEKRVNQPNLELAIIGHELRNVLCGVSALSEMLASSGLRSDQLPLTGALQYSLQQMQWLIDAIDLQGNDSTLPHSPEPATVHGIELLEQLIRCHTIFAHARRTELLLVVDPALPCWWQIDKHLLRLVLDNLLENAIKYTHSSEVVVEVLSILGDRIDPAGLEIRVRDGGAGIDRQTQQQMFDPWVRSRKCDSNTRGSGLGLHVCQRMVSLLEGSINYRSDQSSGSCFTLQIPGVFMAMAKDKPEPGSALLRSLVCVLSLPDQLRIALTSILERLGVSQVLCSEPGRPEFSEQTCVIQIADPDRLKPGGRRRGGLNFSLFSPGAGDAGAISPRWLSGPFVESTVGPVLMELALEYQLALKAKMNISPASCEKRGSFPERR